MAKVTKYKDVNSLEQFLEFMKHCEQSLEEVTYNSTRLQKDGSPGKWHINLRRKTISPGVQIELVSKDEFLRVAKDGGYNLETNNSIQSTIGRVAELIAIKRLMSILNEHKKKIGSPLLLVSNLHNGPLIDIKIPCVNTYLNVKGKMIYTSHARHEFIKRMEEDSDTVFLYHFTPNKDVRAVLKYFTKYMPNHSYYVFAIPFAINYPGWKYHNPDEPIPPQNEIIKEITSADIQGSSGVGTLSSVELILEELREKTSKQLKEIAIGMTRSTAQASDYLSQLNQFLEQLD